MRTAWRYPRTSLRRRSIGLPPTTAPRGQTLGSLTAQLVRVFDITHDRALGHLMWLVKQALAAPIS